MKGIIPLKANVTEESLCRILMYEYFKNEGEAGVAVRIMRQFLSLVRRCF